MELKEADPGDFSLDAVAIAQIEDSGRNKRKHAVKKESHKFVTGLALGNKGKKEGRSDIGFPFTRSDREKGVSTERN